MTICNQCRHCKRTNIPDTPCMWMECRKVYYIDRLYGDKHYTDCSKIIAEQKRKGIEDCPMFQKRKWWQIF